MISVLSAPFVTLWQGKDIFAEVKKIDGKVYRSLEGRRTLRFEHEGRGYFLKYHAGVGWREIVKNLSQGRIAVLGAENEYRAVKKLQQLGVGTMNVVAFGSRGLNPAKRESFIITEAVEPSVSLEDLAEQWLLQAPTASIKHTFIRRVATMAGKMHAGGVNHRDFYICHFLLSDNGDLALIDLHRSLIHKKVPARWLLKDLAGLYFSAYRVKLTRRDKLRFIQAYSRAFNQTELRTALSSGLSSHTASRTTPDSTSIVSSTLWDKVEKKSQALYLRGLKKGYLKTSERAV